jgi:hypothetical protein
VPVRYEIVTGGLTLGTPPAQQPIVDFKVELPDTFAGQSLNASGFISPLAAGGGLAAAVVLSGSLTLPSVPGAGLSLNWIIEVNATTGVMTLKTGSAATTGTQVTPSADAGNVTMFVHTITNGDTVPWARAPTLTDLNP